jgi:hypothetical protein
LTTYNETGSGGTVLSRPMYAIFNGSTSHIDIPNITLSMNDNWTLEVDVYVNNFSANHMLGGTRLTNNHRIGFPNNPDQFRVRFNQYSGVTPDFSSATWFKLRVNHNGTTGDDTVFVNNVQVVSGTNITTNSTNWQVIGAFQDSQHFNGFMKNMLVNDAGVQYFWPLDLNSRETLQSGFDGTDDRMAYYQLASYLANINATGGVVCAGEAGINSSEKRVATGGAVLGGTVAFKTDVQTTGGVVCAGEGDIQSSTIIVLNTTGGVVVGGIEANVKTFHIFAIVECLDNQFHCALPNQDELCLTFSKVRGFGSKIFQKTENLDICSGDSCNTDSAYIASIVLCRREILPPLIVKEGEQTGRIKKEVEIEKEPIMMSLVDGPMIFNQSTSQQLKFKPVTNTPQMKALKVASLPELNEDGDEEMLSILKITKLNKQANSPSKPTEKPSVLSLVESPLITVNSKSNLKMRPILNTPQMAQFKKEMTLYQSRKICKTKSCSQTSPPPPPQKTKPKSAKKIVEAL